MTATATAAPLPSQALPAQVMLESNQRAASVPMVLTVTQIPTETLSRAFSMSQDGKWKVFKGTGPKPTGHNFACGTKIFFNKIEARLEDVTTARVQDCEVSHDGRFYRKLSSASLKSFSKKHMSLSCAEKLADGTWICRCHDWQYGGHCSDVTVALSLDGRIDIPSLLRDCAGNRVGGRPTKQAAALARQPKPVDPRDSTLPGPRATGAEFTAIAGCGAKRQRSGPKYQPTGKQFLGSFVAKKFKDG